MDGSLKKFKDNTLLNQFIKIRKKTNHLISSLHPEDVVIQTKDFVSPIKWHLGHTTWFFENFLLVPYLKGYKILIKNLILFLILIIIVLDHLILEKKEDI